MKQVLAFVLVLGGCTPVPVLYGVPRLEQIDVARNVWRSAQPETPEEWATLFGLGIKRDVVLRASAEWPSDPYDAQAVAAGIMVYPIEMPPATPWQLFEAPSEYDTERAVSVLELGNAVVHCRWGQDRTGWVVLRYKHEVLGASKGFALDDALDHGMHTPLLLGLAGAVEDWLSR